MKHLRTLLAALAVGAVAAAPSPLMAAHAADGSNLTILATTDVHGHVYNWDYFADAAYPQGKIKELGLARVCSIVNAQRTEKGADSVVMVDNGDATQGTPLTYLAAKQPEKLPHAENPMATAFNLIGYDAQNLGNHEFNYGLDYLNGYIGQLDAPVLSANILKAGTQEPNWTPYTIVNKKVDGKDVKVGILGLDTPWIRTWDKKNVEGKLDFADIVLTAQKYVPQMKAAGADVVVALVHSGLDAEGVDWDPEALQENLAKTLATHVNDIDVVIGGHSHVLENLVFHAPDGDPVLFAQPDHWATEVSEVSLPLSFDAEGKPSVNWPTTEEGLAALTKSVSTSTAEDCSAFANNQILKDDHQAAIDYVNTPVANSVEELSAETSYYEDTPILDYIAMVQRDTVKDALKGTENENLPVITQVSPFSRTAKFPKGQVTIKDIAGLYTYENTLLGVKLTGKQLKDYLEWSARYYVQTEEGAEFDPVNGVNALYPGETRGIMDYAYDALQGLDYLIDVSKPVGQRILGFSHPDGTPVADDEEFVLAINNYRQSGGSEYPHVVDAPVVYDEVQEIRQLIIDRAASDGVIDPADFFEDNWALVTKAPTPAVAADKETYAPGEKVTATLTGFLPERETKVSIAGGEPVVVTTDAQGCATVELTAPATLGSADILAQQSALSATTSVMVAEKDTPSDDPTDGSDATPTAEPTTPAPSVTPAPTVKPAPTPSKPLARTGAQTAGFAAAMALIAAGGAMLLRRRDA